MGVVFSSFVVSFVDHVGEINAEPRVVMKGESCDALAQQDPAPQGMSRSVGPDLRDGQPGAATRARPLEQQGERWSESPNA